MSDSTVYLEHESTTLKLGLAGPATAAWLEELGLQLPAAPFEVCELDDDGYCVRWGTAEIFLELVAASDWAMRLASALESTPPGVYRVPRNEATFLLNGPQVASLMAQTCGINFRQAHSNTVVFTRMAGVSCGVLPLSVGAGRFRVWVDYSYANYLWETLRAIVAELGGTASRETLPKVPAATW